MGNAQVYEGGTRLCCVSRGCMIMMVTMSASAAPFPTINLKRSLSISKYFVGVRKVTSHNGDDHSCSPRPQIEDG
jgi:hypothetical protein